MIYMLPVREFNIIKTLIYARPFIQSVAISYERCPSRAQVTHCSNYAFLMPGAHNKVGALANETKTGGLTPIRIEGLPHILWCMPWNETSTLGRGTRTCHKDEAIDYFLKI